ncbi:MAG: polysaccharide pyruvyl transferase family protein [Candidatus Gastranaerophilales bacterium]|nr:polysaccharide pyruvyl transferase family protein [Candidatus Gastranaerophilales bacterium]
MKKIAIITFGHVTNYGNRLQNFALQKVLNDMGHSVETISPDLSPARKIRKIISRIIYPKRNSLYDKREINFNKFDDEYVNYSKEKIGYFTPIKKIANKYDAFILGSDQIWNPTYGYNMKSMFGFGLPKNKLFSYSASFGISDIPQKYINNYTKYLDNINVISVRENRAIDIVKKLTGKDVVKTLDPTLLLDSAEYEKLSLKPNKLSDDEKYIITYFLRDIPSEISNKIDNFSKDNKLKVINLCQRSETDSYIYEPREFVYLIKNAKTVLTDSFHSCVFSIILGTPFSLYDSKFESVKNNNSLSRLDSLLNDLKLNDRKNIDLDDKKIFESDYTASYEIIKKQKQKSIMFLENILNN